jgi:hypothetical protein
MICVCPRAVLDAVVKRKIPNPPPPALMSVRKYDVIPQIGDVVTELSMEKIHLQIMLSDVG